MCYGYRGWARWWDQEDERRRLELLQEQERESLRARQDEELRRLEQEAVVEEAQTAASVVHR